jgi:hypothetical protein
VGSERGEKRDRIPLRFVFKISNFSRVELTYWTPDSKVDFLASRLPPLVLNLRTWEDSGTVAGRRDKEPPSTASQHRNKYVQCILLLSLYNPQSGFEQCEAYTNIHTYVPSWECTGDTLELGKGGQQCVHQTKPDGNMFRHIAQKMGDSGSTSSLQLFQLMWLK